jgi:hypothetical protein
VLDDDALSDGGTLTLQRDTPPGSTVGVTDEALMLTVQAVDAASQHWPVCVLEVPLRVYRLVDEPTWDLAGPRYLPWVAAIDPALRAIEGTAATQQAVLSALVRWVYQESGLSYDTRAGASAYTVYLRNDWEQATFDMSSFLARRFGTVVNCSDCAGIMVGFGNMLGALAEYAILGWDFDLNYILAIGGDTYTECPFGGRGCGFSYHAVAVTEPGEWVWDATLAVDGDDEPDLTPNDELLVQEIDADEYLFRLSSESPDYRYWAQGSIQ